MNKKLIKNLKENYPEVTLVMASKYLNNQELQAFYEQGVHNFGENRVESFLEKKAASHDAITWHFIGTLQSKKVKKVINDIDILHTVDRIKIMDEIEKYRQTPLKVFIQFNISNEASKHGFLKHDIENVVKALRNYSKIDPIGVMGMAENTSDKDLIRTQFKALIDIKNLLHQEIPSIRYLSMGMSDDYDVALSLNTTHLRLGRILLEDAC